MRLGQYSGTVKFIIKSARGAAFRLNEQASQIGHNLISLDYNLSVGRNKKRQTKPGKRLCSRARSTGTNRPERQTVHVNVAGRESSSALDNMIIPARFLAFLFAPPTLVPQADTFANTSRARILIVRTLSQSTKKVGLLFISSFCRKTKQLFCIFNIDTS